MNKASAFTPLSQDDNPPPDHSKRLGASRVEAVPSAELKLSIKVGVGDRQTLSVTNKW